MTSKGGCPATPQKMGGIAGYLSIFGSEPRAMYPKIQHFGPFSGQVPDKLWSWKAKQVSLTEAQSAGSEDTPSFSWFVCLGAVLD